MTMRAMGPILAGLVGCVTPQQGGGAGQPAGGGDAAIAGTYRAEGAEIVLRQDGDQVTGTAAYGGMTGTLTGALQGGQVVGTYSTQDGRQGQFVAAPTGDGGLQIAFDGGQPLLFARAGDPAAPPAAAAIGDETIPPPGARAASGPAHRAEYEGWQVRTPARWKFAVQGARLLFGSDSEAGLIVVWFIPGVGYQEMESQAAAGAAQIGMTLAGPPISADLKGGRALVSELVGTAPDGSKVRGRAIGVAGAGGVVAVVGLTTPEKFSVLRDRVDALAASASFFKPKRSPAMSHLVGAWWHWHGSSSGAGSTYSGSSYERTIVLCSDGTFRDSDASDISINTETKAAAGSTDAWGNSIDKIYGSASSNRAGAGAGRWIAIGDDLKGSLELRFDSGNVERRAYVFKKRGGGDIELDGRWYGRDPQKYQGCSDSR